MNMEDLPILTVSEVKPDSPQIKGEVSRWHWVGEGHIAYLYLNEDRFIEGKFRSVDESSKRVSFAIKNPDYIPEVKPGESIPYFDGYWGERAIIVLDHSLEWNETSFKVRDAVFHYKDGTTKVEPDVWDHEHCAICWATISENDNQRYMKSSQDDYVCLNCFRNYVEPKNIDFIQEA